MSISTHSTKNDLQILALGAESTGNFSVFSKGHFFHSEDFGDLLEPKNFARFQKSVLAFLKKEKIKPDVIITDLHPLYVTSIWGKELARKFKIEHVQVQHHVAHIFSQIESDILQDTRYKIQDTKKLQTVKIKSQNFFGIALDGTGYGLDGKIWGGEIFELKTKNHQLTTNRIGHLENQIMIGGELAIQEPARILIAILAKFIPKNKIYAIIKNSSSSHDREQMTSSDRIYSKSEFEVLYNQLQQNFNCLETSSTGRILDAVSILLGFAKNERNTKHEATYLLEENSTEPYRDLKPKIIIKKQGTRNNDQSISNNQYSIINSDTQYILDTTHLFQYLIKNINKNKKRLAATAQLYIAEGLYKIICHSGLEPESSHKTSILDSRFHGNDIILSGGISNNKIISEYFENKKTGTSSKIPVVQVPRGDAGLSVGQISYSLMTRYESNN